MTRTHALLLGPAALFALAMPTGCILDPKSTGDLDAMDADGSGTGGSAPGTGDGGGSMSASSGAAVDGADSSDGGDADSSGGDPSVASCEPGPPPDTGCGPECTTPAASTWSTLVPAAGGYVWVCDVAFDDAGRVALAWNIDPSPELPEGRTGVALFDPDGTPVADAAVDGQIYGAIAFASDGTLRVRGGTALGGGAYQEWTKALDADLEETWSDNHGRGGPGQCAWGWRGVVVDPGDNVVTYTYAVDPSRLTHALVRRLAPDGTLLWERDPGGNPGERVAPIAIGTEQAVFHGASILYDAHDELEIRKFSAEGELEWLQVVPGTAGGLWGTADGGVYAFTTEEYGVDQHIHRLGPDGECQWSATTQDDGSFRVIAPVADETGFFAVASDGLRRVDTSLQTIWTSPIDMQESGEYIFAAEAWNEEAFAFGNPAIGDDVWLEVLEQP